MTIFDVVPCTSSSENFAFHGDKMGGKDQEFRGTSVL